nr:PAS domain S-box protein [uncultured Mucilaginibacter sp.]
MNHWLRKYERIVKGQQGLTLATAKGPLIYWKNQLFFSFLLCCLPFCLIAAIPGIYMALINGYVNIAIADAACVLVIAVVTFANRLPLRLRKLSVVGVFYFLAVFLTNNLGYFGPGVFYLFVITILSALIFQIKYAYWSVAANTALLLFYALNIQFRFFECALNSVYTAGKWIAFSSNLTFLSIVLVVMIHHIFRSLETTMVNKDVLQERYKSIFELSPLPMWLFDTQTLAFVDVNEAAVRNYGYSKSEFLQMTIKDIRPAANTVELEQLVENNRQSGVFYAGHAQHVTKSGETIFVNIESNFFSLEGRQVRLVLATDITEQLNSEVEALNAGLKIKESELNLRAIFNSTNDGFVLLNSFCCVKQFNSKAKDYIKFGAAPREFEIGKSIFDYVEPSWLKNFEAVMRKVYAGEIVEYDRKYQAAPGELAWIRYTITPVYEGDTIKGACICGRDITARKSYIEAIEHQNKIFREISWMQSHLVRAPLARIMGLTTMLHSPADDTEKEEILNYLTISANELDSVIIKITEQSNMIIEKYPTPPVQSPNAER